MDTKNKTFLAGISILIGTIILLANLYLGEIVLRTKGEHQLGGYARKYLGKTGSFFMSFAIIFSVYSAIIAYLVGISGSFSFLFFGNFNYAILIGILFGVFMS